MVFWRLQRREKKSWLAVRTYVHNLNWKYTCLAAVRQPERSFLKFNVENFLFVTHAYKPDTWIACLYARQKATHARLTKRERNFKSAMKLEETWSTFRAAAPSWLDFTAVATTAVVDKEYKIIITTSTLLYMHRAEGTNLIPFQNV